jgi:hypothetical protein
MKNRGIIIVVIAVLAVGFLAVSCGGNIKRVQNGVFSDYDNTITIGKALENNSILKGGKWDTVEMNGRDYVRYTVRMSGTQVQELLPKSFPPAYSSKPHYGSAKEFKFSKITAMADEEIKQVRDIFRAKLDAYERRPERDDFLSRPYKYQGEKMIINDDFLDPYLHTIKDQVTRYGDVIDFNSLSSAIIVIVTWYIDPKNQGSREALFENGKFTDYEIRRTFSDAFSNTNYAQDTELIEALNRMRIKYYDLSVKAQAEYENAMAEYEERRRNDIEPLLTIDGYEIVLSFVMNQDDTFTTNMIEVYTDVTLNCFNNVKVRYNVANSNNAQSILTYIYRGFTPNFF